MSTTTTLQVDEHTRAMLRAGAIAGPLYVGIGTAEAIARDGFDIRVHSLSLLANGSWGWIHSAMMVGTGVLTILGVIGLARSMPGDRRPRVAVPGLFLYGLGLIAAGLMRADPAEGFPLGTPEGPPEAVTWHGMGHLVSGGLSFLGLIVACLAFSRWFGRSRQRGWAIFSGVTGAYYFVSFAGIASGAGNTVVNLAFTAAVVLGWAWLSGLMVREMGVKR